MAERLFSSDTSFPKLAKVELGDTQLRKNLQHATHTIRNRRRTVVDEVESWQELRKEAALIKDHTLSNLDTYLELLQQQVEDKGGHVHFAHDAKEANEIVKNLVRTTAVSDVVKVKSMTTAEIGLNDALKEAGINSYETDLAELIVQLDDDLPSHILVPAIHKNRSQIREIFLREMEKRGTPAPKDLTDDPVALASAARIHLRNRFLGSKVGISGANFLVAESGSLVIVESEGNGRMCVTLPETLISIVGVEKLLPTWESLSVFMQLLPRSSTGERMNPYTSIFSGVTPGDGPKDFHLVLLDNGRSGMLNDPFRRQTLRCIRCSACLNVCPVYERAGGHAYGSPYPGPIGAILQPQLRLGTWGELERSLPYASSLCGACYEVCPVMIDIPKILVDLRSQVVDDRRTTSPPSMEALAMRAVKTIFSSSTLFERSAALSQVPSKLFHVNKIKHLPGYLSRWTNARDLPLPGSPSFRQWLGDKRPSVITLSGSARPRPRSSLSWSRLRLRSLALVGSKRARSINVPTSKKTTVLSTIASSCATNDGLRGAPVPKVRRTQVNTAPEDELIELLCDRLSDYKAHVHDSDSDSVLEVITEVLRETNTGTIVVPQGLPEEYYTHLSAKVTVDSEDLDAIELDKIDTAITQCALAVAETGTIVLDGSLGQGRRIVSLIPDHHIVILRKSQVVKGVAEAVDRLDPTKAQTWISGPSATSDIELTRIEGVHGPRRLDVILTH
ncbi:iron-sulfur cluster-binding protein [Ferrithrix thermotolerans DSM 19514]|uniref:Iron-sulfur cluster-binding protein n=1 Tax=Ferrithrix thermotolerans DSM 19514 TaxID=1121881 RepID=A0A1M4Y4M6_9ACTN|nr:LutB/LldF family L-lactate oxidation iron-sulfur protein [Ferrithrix thermotolerans]SHF00658.1 iron-sulfur cluster-binding protein [Ferrithrix thermotolerans DSM 19514]